MLLKYKKIIKRFKTILLLVFNIFRLINKEIPLVFKRDNKREFLRFSKVKRGNKRVD
jgi:hypothetical protein